MSFTWDSDGISGYERDGGSYDYSKYTRMDRFGFYAVDGAVDYKPQTTNQIWEDSNVLYCLTKRGLRLGNNENSQIILDTSGGEAKLTVNGSIVVTNGGKIGNWNIGTYDIQYNDPDDPNATFKAWISARTDGKDYLHFGTDSGTSGFTGFRVDGEGKMYATGGNIAGWQITDHELIGGNSTYGYVAVQVPGGNNPSKTNVFMAGSKSKTDYSKAPFRVTADGSVYATKGIIAGWDMVSDEDAKTGTLAYVYGSGNNRYGVGIQANGTGSAVFAAGFKVPDGVSPHDVTWGNENTPFYVTPKGELHATGAEISGTITSASGNIAGWKIGHNSFTYGSLGQPNSMWLLSSGSTTTASFGSSGNRTGWVIGAGSNFGVTREGKVYATSIHISGDSEFTGKISATSGNLSSGVTIGTPNWGETIYIGHIFAEDKPENQDSLLGTGFFSQKSNPLSSIYMYDGHLTLESYYGNTKNYPSTIQIGQRWIDYDDRSGHYYSITLETAHNARSAGATYQRGALIGNWYKLGNSYSTSAVSISSDINKKNNISYFSEKYELFYDNIQPTTYKYNNGTSNRIHSGFIAQQINKSLIEANLNSYQFAGLVIDKYEINGEEKEDWYLRYEEFIALNTWQIQKLKSRVTELENEIQSLKQKLS